MSTVMPNRQNEVYGRTCIPSRVRTLLGSTGVEVYHEEGEPVWITYAYARPRVTWEPSEEPVLSSELC